MDADEFAELVGDLLAGCQVPMSMGALGAAREPLVKLRAELGIGFGWHDADEARLAVKKFLGGLP
jgi:hypothetical protein